MFLGMPEFILRLLIQPAFCRSIESNGKPDCHFGTYSGLAIQHCTQCFAANAQCFCRRGDRKTKGLNTKLSQYFTRMRRVVH